MGSECSSKSETGRTVRKEGDTSEMYSNHSGSRSGKKDESNVQKQFLQLGEYPVLYYSLKAFSGFTGNHRHCSGVWENRNQLL